MTENNFEIVNKGFFWLLLLVPLLAGYLWWMGNRLYPYLKISSIRGFVLAPDIVSRSRVVLWVLRLAAISCIIIAMTRPRDVEVSTKTRSGLGVDIAMAIDLSGSMMAADLKPNRLEALKKVAAQFVEGRAGDRIALVTYATEAFTQTPLTTDKRIIVQAINGLEQGLIGETTAIGMGLGTAINRLKDSEAKSKVIILLTDGVNNDGFVDPRTVASVAKKLGIKVYTIGIGTNGLADYPIGKDPRTGRIVYQKMPVEIDERLMKDIATETGGKYFRATDEDKLSAIYKEIDSLEKSKVEDIKYYNYAEMFRPWLLAALILFALETLLRSTVYKGFL